MTTDEEILRNLAVEHVTDALAGKLDRPRKTREAVNNMLYRITPYLHFKPLLWGPRVGQLIALNDGSLDSRLCFRACPADEKPHDGDQ